MSGLTQFLNRNIKYFSERNNLFLGKNPSKFFGANALQLQRDGLCFYDHFSQDPGLIPLSNASRRYQQLFQQLDKDIDDALGIDKLDNDEELDIDTLKHQYRIAVLQQLIRNHLCSNDVKAINKQAAEVLLGFVNYLSTEFLKNNNIFDQWQNIRSGFNRVAAISIMMPNGKMLTYMTDDHVQALFEYNGSNSDYFQPRETAVQQAEGDPIPHSHYVLVAPNNTLIFISKDQNTPTIKSAITIKNGKITPVLDEITATKGNLNIDIIASYEISADDYTEYTRLLETYNKPNSSNTPHKEDTLRIDEGWLLLHSMHENKKSAANSASASATPLTEQHLKNKGIRAILRKSGIVDRKLLRADIKQQKSHQKLKIQKDGSITLPHSIPKPPKPAWKTQHPKEYAILSTVYKNLYHTAGSDFRSDKNATLKQQKLNIWKELYHDLCSEFETHIADKKGRKKSGSTDSLQTNISRILNTFIQDDNKIKTLSTHRNNILVLQNMFTMKRHSIETRSLQTVHTLQRYIHNTVKTKNIDASSSDDENIAAIQRQHTDTPKRSLTGG